MRFLESDFQYLEENDYATLFGLFLIAWLILYIA